ncbi:MAG: hypothetical protein GC146_02795 [Limimaricola sp.]|uniref:excalibur calcium-binding domain-containing protein n=1 Tax=Limimaricola sp. TaxID=2211665 RepID=UPI001DAB520F|nr:hypothetical protein [Limimaricola sp.]
MKLAVISFVLVLAISGCDRSPGSESDISSLSTSELWRAHGVAQARRLALVEAELGQRGEFSSGADYLGKTTGAAFGRQIYSRQTAMTDTKNCSDFSSAASAQQYFLAHGGPAEDPSGLDRDGDGLACEWGTSLRANATHHVSAARAATTHFSYASRCYVGPRGGTYTITASGRKNYGGC